MRYIDLKSDIAFKKIFGNQNHQEALLEFLNQKQIKINQCDFKVKK